MNRVDLALLTWSGLAAVWWLLAFALLVRTRRPPQATVSAQSLPSITIFKPLPPVADDTVRSAHAQALETFIKQLDDTAEMLIGIPAEEAEQWRSVLDDWRVRFPLARVSFVIQSTPRQRANPKIAWLEILAPSARGDCWLWSDSDISVPPGWLNRLRRDFAASAAGAITSPYCVRHIRASPGMVDALFVNIEFLPGALLLGHLGPVKLSFGAAVLFRADDFVKRTSWAELGECLADDYVLGQRLAPVQMSGELVETSALETRVGGALRHGYRWQKTIRWCRPGSYAALILILPMLGWIARCLVTPGAMISWVGLSLQYTMDLLALVILTRIISPELFVRGWRVLLIWPWLRALGWLAAWLPWPVFWSDLQNPWRAPKQQKSTRP